MFSSDGRFSLRHLGGRLAVGASVLFVAVGLLMMHGIEPTGAEPGHAPHAVAVATTASHEAMAAVVAPMEQVVTTAMDDVTHAHVVWACVWILVSALLLVGVFPKLGAPALGADGSRAALRVAFARAPRAPPSSTRLSLVGVLLR